jgi:hypothetical protein
LLVGSRPRRFASSRVSTISRRYDVSLPSRFLQLPPSSPSPTGSWPGISQGSCPPSPFRVQPETTQSAEERQASSQRSVAWAEAAGRILERLEQELANWRMRAGDAWRQWRGSKTFK